MSTINHIYLPQIVNVYLKSIFKLTIIILGKLNFFNNPQPDPIFLNFLQFYMIFNFEVNKCQFLRKLGIFCVNCIFWKVNIIDIFNSKKP